MISLTLTRRELVAQNPCAEGLALFEGFVDLQGRRHSIRIRDWTPLHSVWFATCEPSFSSWLVDRGLIHAANLSSLTCLDQAYYPAGTVPVGWVRDRNGYLSRAK